MAVHPTLESSSAQRQGQLTATEISAWTEQAAESLQNLQLSSATRRADRHTSSGSSPRPVSSTLVIPLDGDHRQAEHTPAPLRLKNVRLQDADEQEPVRLTYRRGEPIRRDSLKRREALLKGKEGSRRRQRWENDRLLNNPWAQPPSAMDWQVQPTYPRHSTVPYYLAALWDSHYAAKQQAHASKRKAHSHARADAADNHISKELRLKLKHARAAKGMLQDLEEEIRKFVQKSNEKQLAQKLQADGASMAAAHAASDADDSDVSDDEIVFVGRKQAASTRERQQRNQRKESEHEKLVFESSADDRGAGFGRWLVHSLASYYGLRTWSVTAGNPPRREAYVGIDPVALERRHRSQLGHPINPGLNVLPRPLWVSV